MPCFFRALVLLCVLPAAESLKTRAHLNVLATQGLLHGRRAVSPVCGLAEERVESAKVGVASALSGSLAMAPFALLLPSAFSAQWELSHDVLAVMLFLFGLVYRYAVRSDSNAMLKQGVIGAFALTRCLSALQASEQCTALPLVCGPPFSYLDYAMILQLLSVGFESFAAFGGSAFVIEACFERGLLTRLSGTLPTDETA
uniref:Solute carrier family 40 protein n=1 Tax=Coccolithus braarudii TaxID=221442 RepID=A0A7S0LTL0_9EUKA|eukprot:CAMPEP_0183352702 /NCGR_PEP_ID=MMETSP0164_2-20130417/29908_1 /TAXON_ID=221442 /ORGANISM="Coccolithus pelagicus ssp braarudi, Strain PLY182g" /LENGTH=199 /DNA_ID=CAMNT_0025525207 /DNA_START=19 /DNA_END=618 /DNA_ORIENTATION=+